jgi:hypothetical protein
LGKKASINSSGTRIVHFYSPRAHFVRRLVASVAVVVALTLAVLGGLVAARSLLGDPASELPRPTRVVNVKVTP